MNFCSKCGQALEPGDQFCQECGTPIGSKAEESLRAGPELEDKPQTREEITGPLRVRRPGKLGLLAAVLVVLAGVIVGAYYVGAAAYAPERTVEAFRQAVESRDIDKLSRLLRPGSDEMSVSRKDLERLVDYYKAYPADLEQAVEQLNEGIERGEAAVGAPLTLVQNGKFLLYDLYIIEVAPYYVTLSTNMEGAELYVGDARLATAASDAFRERFGPYWPGEYEVKAVYSGEFTSLTETQQLRLYGQREQEAYLELKPSYAQFESGIQDAIVYVNGVSTGRTVRDFDGRIGPLAFDGSTTLHAEAKFPWGTYSSAEIVLTPELENSVVTFLFEDAHEAALEQVMNAVNEYLASWVPAYKSMDIRQFTNITEERRSLFASDFQWMLETGQRFTGEIVGSEFDLDSFVLDGGYNGNPYTAEIDVAYVLRDAAWYYVGEEPQLRDMHSFNRYKVIFDEESGRWVISYFTALDSIDLTNTRAYKFE